MIKLTMRALCEKPGINVFVIIILSLIFSVQMLLYGWVGTTFNGFKDNYATKQAIYYNLIFAILIVISVSSIITFINYVIGQRRVEFNVLISCGATPLYIYCCKLLHLLIVVIISEFLGIPLFFAFRRILNQKYELKSMLPVFLMFTLITIAELSLNHIIRRRNENGHYRVKKCN